MQLFLIGDKVLSDPTIPKRVKIIQSSIRPEDNILDIGCNEGVLTRFLEAKSIIGLDYDQGAIRKAKSKDNRPHVRYVVGDAYDLKFKDGTFDSVIMGDIIEHLYDGNKALTEANGVLKKGGKLLISCPYHGFLKDLIIAAFFFEKHYDVEWQHIRFYTVRSLTKMLEKNNFIIVKKHFIGRVPLLWRNMLFECEKH